MSQTQPPKITTYLPGSILTSTAQQVSKRLGYPGGHAELAREQLSLNDNSVARIRPTDSSDGSIEDEFLPFREIIQTTFRDATDWQHIRHLMQGLQQFGGGSLAVAAQRIGKGKGEVARWERGQHKPQFTTLLRILSAHNGTWQSLAGHQIIGAGLRECLTKVLEMIGRPSTDPPDSQQFTALHYTLFSSSWWRATLDLKVAMRSKSELAISTANERLALMASAISNRVRADTEYSVDDLNELVRQYGEAWCVLLFLIPYRDWAFGEESADNDF